MSTVNTSGQISCKSARRFDVVSALLVAAATTVLPSVVTAQDTDGSPRRAPVRALGFQVGEGARPALADVSRLHALTGTASCSDLAYAATSGPAALVYHNSFEVLDQFYAPQVGFAAADDLQLVGTERQLVQWQSICVHSPFGTAPFNVTMQLHPDDGSGQAPVTSNVLANCAALNVPPDDGKGAPDLYDAGALGGCSFAPGVIIPDIVRLSLTFSTNDAGWVIARQAELGFTNDSSYETPPGGLFFFEGVHMLGSAPKSWRSLRRPATVATTSGSARRNVRSWTPSHVARNRHPRFTMRFLHARMHARNAWAIQTVTMVTRARWALVMVSCVFPNRSTMSWWNVAIPPTEPSK